MLRTFTSSPLIIGITMEKQKVTFILIWHLVSLFLVCLPAQFSSFVLVQIWVKQLGYTSVVADS